MNIEIGEYIRTKKGNIGKVLDITTCTGQKRKKYLIKWNIVKAYYITGTTIVKHTPNIIDLIEEGDYINGLRVEKNKYGELYGSYVYYGGDIGTQCEVYTRWIDDLKNEDITSIVTKQQFSNMEYKIDE